MRISTPGQTIVALPVDGIDARRLAAFVAFAAPALPRLVITARRARALGLDVSEPVAISLTGSEDVESIEELVADAQGRRPLEAGPAGAPAKAAIELAKFAQRLPALLVAEADAAGAAYADPPLVSIDAESIAKFRRSVLQSLTIAGEAQVPLHGGHSTKFVVFRDAVGGGSVAVVVGKPDFSQPVPVRLHSACLTGDVFGSRRCDCGDQLKLALARLDEAGGGVILYLEQEGRGVGLVNKMRAYQLQDEGLDTVDANTTLGFDDDERDYGIAARMLEMLGCTRVRLLTNNPAKVDSLAGAGIEVSGRLPLYTPINADNRRYLTAKATRAGHRLDHLVAALSDADKAAGS
ncbi:MAG TPA: GTP cyclohydrolase II [Xanthobacteraceae bacterium]|nr:GTP cyclohydrolase II [Xanthobacteraceae bacterium]